MWGGPFIPFYKVEEKTPEQLAKEWEDMEVAIKEEMAKFLKNPSKKEGVDK